MFGIKNHSDSPITKKKLTNNNNKINGKVKFVTDTSKIFHIKPYKRTTSNCSKGENILK